MSNSEIVKSLFNFNYIQNLKPIPKIPEYLSQYDIDYLNEIAKSYTVKDPKDKYKLINQVMEFRGFSKLGCGTNRITFKHNTKPDIVLKVAIDVIGMNDGPAELRNKQFLKNFAVDVYDVSPCGTVGLFERVNPITNVDDFLVHAGTIFDTLYSLASDGYIFKDVGNNSFMNYGVRKNFGPVLLDFPYFYKVDPKKLTCKNIFNGSLCLGRVDFDKGLNTIKCPKCGREYLLNELKDPNANLGVKIENDKGAIDMKITIKMKNGKTYVHNTGKETENIISDEGYDKYNIPDEEDLEFENTNPNALVVNMEELLNGKKEKKQNKSYKEKSNYKTKSKFIPESKPVEEKKDLNEEIKEIVETKEVESDEDKAEITESILNKLKDSMTAGDDEEQDYSNVDYEEEEEQEEELIEEGDDTEEPETFEKIKKDKTDVYDEY